MAGQWHLDAETYLSMVRAEIPSYDELQDRLADATADMQAETVLDLGPGTGVTAARVLSRHPRATLTGIRLQPRHAQPCQAGGAEGGLRGGTPRGPSARRAIRPGGLGVHHPPFAERGQG